MSSLYADHLPQVPDETFKRVLQFRSQIIDLFSSKPTLLDMPYQIIQSQYNDAYCTISSALDNEIVKGLYDRGVDFDAIQPEKDFAKWNTVEFPPVPYYMNDSIAWIALNKRSYAMIDLCVYLVRIANVYYPNRGVLKNVYASSVEIDAIGRSNEAIALKAIKKIVSRYDFNVMDEDQIARHLILMIKDENVAGVQQVPPKGLAFELECQRALLDVGFQVTSTARSGDFGADVIAIQDGITFVIQCKDTVKNTGVSAVQEAVAAKRHYISDFAVVCSSAKCTDAAVSLAASNEGILSSPQNLAQMLLSA